MFIYIIQTIFLLLIAFALGALVGYLLKRYFGCPAETQSDFGADGSSAAASSSTTSSTLAASSASVSESASGADTQASGLMASTEVSSSSDEAADKAASAETETSSTAKAAPKKAATAKKTTTAKKATSTAKKAPASKPAASKAKPAAQKTAAQKTAAKKPAAKKPAAAATGPDDLKLIKGVGKLNETRLNEEGITTFAQVAAWKKADIAAFDEKLNFKGRIEREEWVPQAKALAKDAAKKKPAAATTAGAKKAAAPKAAAKTVKAPAAKTAAAKAPTAKKAPAKKPAAKKPAAKKAASAKPDDLKLIKGVGKLIETKLAKEGITQYSQIAAWKKADIADFDEKLSFKGRIERDEWVSQAKILAKGGTTEFSKRASKGDVPSSS